MFTEAYLEASRTSTMELFSLRLSRNILKGCVCYIFARLFLSLNESPCETRKNVFSFTSKALFILKKIKF